ncbi:MAG: methionine--tRNA ligase [Candidatus Woesearchaeota archaeon]
MAKPTFYITTAIDYANAKPHIGHAYEKIIADALARWHKQLGEDVYFLTGTDEHGSKVEKTALAQGKKPKQFVDEIVVYFQELLKKLNISNNYFIRTSSSKHKKICQSIFQKVLDKGLIYKGQYEGLYCSGCEAFYTEKDLVNGVCPVHQKAPDKISEESYFFKLLQFQDFLLKHFEAHPEFLLPDFRRNEIVNRLKEGLKDLSVSRKTIKWGIPLPNDKSHVIYVWFDALLNYITALGYPDGKKFRKYWPANVHIIGKDIAWFHTIIWPAILQAAGIPLPKTVHTHGWVKIGGEKMSKSLGTIIDPVALADKYGADALRLFLLREIPAGNDGDFSEEALISRANADLGDTLGNLLQRTSVLVHKNFAGQIPKPARFTKEDKELIAHADKILAEANALMQKFEWHRAVETVWTFLHACNKYVNDQAPWQIQDQQRLATVLYVVVECLRLASILTWPFIPATAEKISAQLGQKLGNFKKAKFKRSTKGTLLQPEILFKKIEVHDVACKPEEPAAEHEPFRKLQLKVAKVEDAQPHPDADKLLVLKISLGTEQRQLVAGIKAHYQPEQLKGKNIVVLTNLKPAVLRGIESKGMLLAAQLGNEVKLLEAPNSQPGSDVFVEGIPCEHDEITIDDFAKVKITTKSCKAVYKDKPLKTSKEEISVQIGDNATVR